MVPRVILDAELEERLGSLRERHKVPGVAVGVLEGGHALRCVAGDTSLDDPLPVDERTLFQVASNTKPFTASLVLALVEQGRIELDAPVQSYLPEFRLADPAQTSRVTVRHLLTHRVGWDGDALFVRRPQPPELAAIFEPLAQARQLVAPGTDWTYSNAGFSVAGRLVECLEGAPFDELLRERILAPLGMSSSFTKADQAITHRVAAPHAARADGTGFVVRGRGWQPGWELQPHDVPAGGLISCVDDLLRWLGFQLGHAECEKPPLSAAALAAMHEAQLPPWNAEAGHALGWAIWLANGQHILNHGGLTVGYSSYTFFSPQLDFAAVILTNSLSGGRLHRELSRWLVGKLLGHPVHEVEALSEQPDPARYLGVYHGGLGVRSVVAEDGHLMLRSTANPTDEHSWQPPPDPPLHFAFYAPDRAVVLSPETSSGALLDFAPGGGPSAWLRFGSRIHTRV